jgi:hypothetical protein
VPAPIQRVERWRELAAASAARWGGTAADLLAVIHRESRGDPDAISETGYRGLGQVGRAATADYNRIAGASVAWPRDVMDPANNIEVIATTWRTARAVARQLGYSGLERLAIARAVYGWGPYNFRRAVARWRRERGTSAPPTLGELAAAYPDATVPHVNPWAAARAHLRLRVAYGAPAGSGGPTGGGGSGRPATRPDWSPLVSITPIALAVALAGLVLVAVGVVRYAS